MVFLTLSFGPKLFAGYTQYSWWYSWLRAYTWISKHNCCFMTSKSQFKTKVGVPAMLLRNLGIQNGSCNGIRLIITRMRKYVLEGEVVSQSSVGEKVLIPRLFLSPLDIQFLLSFKDDISL